MRPSFARLPRPFIVSVITEDSPAGAIAAIRNSEYDGAQAFDLHLPKLRAEYRTLEEIRGIVLSSNKPILLIYYRDKAAGSASPSDEERVEAQLLGLQAGASAADLVADL